MVIFGMRQSGSFISFSQKNANSFYFCIKPFRALKSPTLKTINNFPQDVSAHTSSTERQNTYRGKSDENQAFTRPPKTGNNISLISDLYIKVFPVPLSFYGPGNTFLSEILKKSKLGHLPPRHF